jgi:hypothetical protein
VFRNGEIQNCEVALYLSRFYGRRMLVFGNIAERGDSVLDFTSAPALFVGRIYQSETGLFNNICAPRTMYFALFVMSPLKESRDDK